MVEAQHQVLITGGAGQIGMELASAKWPENIAIRLPSRTELDLSAPETIAALFARTRFSAVINCAAYTAVDRAEDDVVSAFAVNAGGPALLAQFTRRGGIPLIQVSTDYVFDGISERPYLESDLVSPLSVYGASKLAGELAVRSGNPRSVVLRTAWVISRHRSNFLKTMLRIGTAQSSVKVVNDQYGSPTSAKDIAEALVSITSRMIQDAAAPVGVYHFVNGGETTWYGLAREIFSQNRLLGGPVVEVDPISTDDYPTAARRPVRSSLDTGKLRADYGVTPREWKKAMSEIVASIAQESGNS